jgi:hypothetical protein
MQRIHEILHPYDRRLFHYPIEVFKEELSDIGLTVKCYSNPLAPGVQDCDILIFHDDNYRDLLPIKTKDRAAAVDFLQGYFEKFPRVIWFDDNDSTGWLRNYVFPLVHVYAKPQLLKDLKYYKETHTTGTIHRDYVVEHHQVEEDCVSKGPISDAEIRKLKMGWNLALKNWNPFITHFPLVMKLANHYSKGYHIRYTSPDLVHRGKIIPYRVSHWKGHPTVTWWRERTREKLVEVMRQNPSYRLASEGRVHKWAYTAEMRSAPVTVSPFGIGEICFRDFESFSHGSLLFKPTMEHMQTWPDLYVDGETYISHKWDFSDFEDKISSILSCPQRFEDVAREGQKRFRKALADGASFAEHFKAMVN